MLLCSLFTDCCFSSLLFCYPHVFFFIHLFLSRLTSLWTSRYTSRTVWKRLCRPIPHAVPLYPAMTAPHVPVVVEREREMFLCLTPACPPPIQHTRARCRSSVPSTYSVVTHCPTPPGETKTDAGASTRGLAKISNSWCLAIETVLCVQALIFHSKTHLWGYTLKSLTRL